MEAALWAVAIGPLVLLVTLVASGRVRTIKAAAASLAAASLIAIALFGVGPAGFTVAVGKGLWSGLWISAVIAAALLLSEISQRVGMRSVVGRLLSILPRRTENVLIVAWIFPSFIQGVAGFGTPIAIVAPILVQMGLRPTMAVALPVVGYHWSVGFGSVGSSFYMGALTAQLTDSETLRFAVDAAVLIGVNAVVAGLLVALMHEGRRGVLDGWRLIAVAGPAMALTQAAVVRLEPAVGALAGGAAGMLAVALLAWTARLRRSTSGIAEEGSQTEPTLAGAWYPRDPRVRQRGVLSVLLPYVVLLVLAISLLAPQPVRVWGKAHLNWGPSFPATATSRGHRVAEVDSFQPFSLLTHPGMLIVASLLISLFIWRLSGHYERDALKGLASSWLPSVRRASCSVLLFATLAAVMADSGMVRTAATGIASVANSAYPAVAPVIGAIGSFTTGSTTNSNALFAGLQADVAALIDVPAGLLVAAQTAGANVGNAIAPVILLLGASAIGTSDDLRPVLRTVALPAAALLSLVMLNTMLLARL